MLRVVDLSSSAPGIGPEIRVAAPANVVVAVGVPRDECRLNTPTFTLTEAPCADRRVITVDSVPETLAGLQERCQRWPHASTVCADVLGAVDPDAATLAAVVTESLGYSTLQSGPEFGRWLAERGPVSVVDSADPVQSERNGATLRISFNRPHRHNAFSTQARAALLEALTVALVDGSVGRVRDPV